MGTTGLGHHFCGLTKQFLNPTLLPLPRQLDKKKEPLTQAVGLSTQADGSRTLK